MTEKSYSILAIAGGIVAALGSILPWATLSTAFGTLSVSGTQGDGILTLAAGAVAAILGIWRFGGSAPGWAAGLTLLAGLAIVGVGVFDYINLSSRLAELSSDVALATHGIGLYITVGGGGAVLIGATPGKKSAAPAADPRAVAAIPDPTATLAELADLRQRGLITEEEFQAKKADVLKRM